MQDLSALDYHAPVTVLGSISARWASMKGDLPLFAMLQVPILLLSILPARALATSYAYPSAPLGYLSQLVFRSLPWDLLFLAILGLLILPTRRLGAPAWSRTPLLLGLYLAFASFGVLHFLASGLFVRVGGTPTWELLGMAPPLLLHAPKVVSSTDPVLVLAGMALLWPAVLTPVLWSAGLSLVRSPREWTRAGWAVPVGLVLVGGVAAALPQDSYRERILRRVSPVNLLRPPAALATRPAELTPRDREVIAGLLGPPRDDGQAALAPLREQELDVVVWVMESVGERFLASHHRFGDALTPHLDRLAARGSVRFSRVHVECPLSIQSNYTLVTGASPPANPTLFKSSLPIEPPAPYLGPAVEAGGRHSAFFNSSDLTIWGEPRFMRDAVDVFEDANNLANRSGYETTDWSFEGRALVERFFSWTDGLPPGEPFLAFVWNVEPHYPHRWVGMPEEIEKADVATRFRAAIEHDDRLLGELYDGLVARGRDEDTLLVVVGDHGQGLGRGGRPYDRFESLLVSEDATQIPLVFMHDSLPEGASVVDTPATLADLYSTLLDLVGVEVPEGVDGASLAREYQPRVSVSRAITWWPLAARAGRFKLVIDSPDDPPELYDLEADPWETRDVSGRHEEVTRALWAFLETLTERLRKEDPSFALF